MMVMWRLLSFRDVLYIDDFDYFDDDDDDDDDDDGSYDNYEY